MKNQGNQPQHVDSREIARAEAIRIGAIPQLRAKSKVWVWDCGRWNKAIVKRRLPGGIYMVEKCSYPGSGERCTISSNTFGGFANAH